MAWSDLLFPIFFTPWTLSHLHTTSFLIGGRHGQAFCKPVPFFGEVSFKVSIQNLILIAVVPFGAMVFPLRSPLIRSKLCPFFILATWIVAVAISTPYLFAKEFVESPERKLCVTKWKKVFGESSSRNSLLPVLLLAILYSNFFIKLKTQDTQVNSPPTLSNSGKEETETCFKCPLLSLQCLCFAGHLSLSTF